MKTKNTCTQRKKALGENNSKLKIWYPYTQMGIEPDPIHITHGRKALLYDKNNKEYIDAISSWWVNIHGHSNKKIRKAINKQLKKIEHVIFAGFTHSPARKLSEKLLSVLPSNQKHIFFSDNGSTAVEVALKMAIQYWYNKKVEKTSMLSFKNAYHGDTFGAMSVNERSIFNKPFEKYLFKSLKIDVPNKDNYQKVIAQLEQHIQNEKIAAFIFEPMVQGAGGMIMYDSSYLDPLIKICKEHNILVIADEVMTGFYRLGSFFASDVLHHKPDIICLSKGITGGFLPLGVTTTTEAIYKVFYSHDLNKAFFHGHSYTGNPIVCTAAITSLKLLQKNKIQKNIKTIERKNIEYMKKLKNNSIYIPILKDVRVMGTILAIEINNEEATSYTNSFKKKVYQFYLSEGVLLRPLGNIIYIMPPYCISKKQLNKVYDTIEKSLQMFIDGYFT